MPSNLKSQPTAGVGASATTVYTAPNPGTATMIGVLVANNGDAALGGQKYTVTFKRGATSYNVIKNVPCAIGDTFVPSGMEGKLVLMNGDQLQVAVDSGTADVIASFLEQTP